MFYITYLRWKKSDDFTGIESYVMEKLKNDDYKYHSHNKEIFAFGVLHCDIHAFKIVIRIY